MPKNVSKTVTVNDVRKGDVVDELLVVSIDKKAKFAYVTLAGADRPRRLALDNTIVVTRVEPTQEELDAKRHAFMVQGLRDQLHKLLKNDPITKLESITAEARKRATYGDVLTWSNLPDVLKAQAKWKIGLSIASGIHTVADRRQLPVDVNGPADVANVPADVLVDAWSYWLYDNVSRKAYDSGVDPTSRSTSAISNLLEDLDRWAVRDVVRELTWTGGLNMLEARVDELEQESKNK